jgi:hypothetical protein
MQSLFVDECKQNNFLLVGFAIANFEHQLMRKLLRSQLLPGQRSLHFKTENMRRKKTIIKVLGDSGCQLVVVRCLVKGQRTSRLCALKTLINSPLAASCKRIVLELDETVRLQDHEFLKRQTSINEWDHRERHQEPLLWVADAVAWCVNRGGEWERMVRPMILETIEC